MFSFVEIFSTFIVMFAIIDITGSIPIFVIRKFFGVILLANAVKLFVNNISKWANICHCSPDTALRDITSLTEKGVFVSLGVSRYCDVRYAISR